MTPKPDAHVTALRGKLTTQWAGKTLIAWPELKRCVAIFIWKIHPYAEWNIFILRMPTCPCRWWLKPPDCAATCWLTYVSAVLRLGEVDEVVIVHVLSVEQVTVLPLAQVLGVDAVGPEELLVGNAEGLTDGLSNELSLREREQSQIIRNKLHYSCTFKDIPHPKNNILF